MTAGAFSPGSAGRRLLPSIHRDGFLAPLNQNLPTRPPDNLSAPSLIVRSHQSHYFAQERCAFGGEESLTPPQIFRARSLLH
ncbi:MAG: hypothetical protein WAK55_19630, partial [Xanthobacteraceae bacterium]